MMQYFLGTKIDAHLRGYKQCIIHTSKYLADAQLSSLAARTSNPWNRESRGVSTSKLQLHLAGCQDHLKINQKISGCLVQFIDVVENLMLFFRLRRHEQLGPPVQLLRNEI